MALGTKKSNTIHSKTGGDLTKLKNQYDDGHIEYIAGGAEDMPHLAALVYQMQLMQEDIDELRRFSGTEQKSKLDTITVGSNQTIDFTMSENRGVYTLTITLVDSSGRTPVTKTGTLTLR